MDDPEMRGAYELEYREKIVNPACFVHASKQRDSVFSMRWLKSLLTGRLMFV